MKSIETRSETAVMSSASAGRFAAALSACAPIPRAEALFAGAPPRNGFTALRLRTKRSDPLQKAESTEKSAETRSESPVMCSASAGRFAAALSACAPIRPSSAQERFPFHTRTPSTPRPERMNARLPALKRVFSPLEYKKRPPEIALRRVDEWNVSRAASDRSLAVPPERLPRFRSALA